MAVESTTPLPFPVIREKGEMRSWSRSRRAAGDTLALVPTMGYLHRGHLSLVVEAKRRAKFTVVSIYVNPGQFAPTEDLATYPSDLQGDLLKLAELGVDAVFCPANLYDCGGGGCSGGGERGGRAGTFTPAVGCEDGREVKLASCIENGGREGAGHETWIRVERLEKGLCGKSRPIFFRGVATVVAKLFNIVEPDFAVFGKKDYQQWRLITRMVRDLDFAVEVIGSDIVRDDDGLAMSSRNVHLSPAEREKCHSVYCMLPVDPKTGSSDKIWILKSEHKKEALSISRSLSKAKLAVQSREISCEKLKTSLTQAIADAGGQVDYVEIVEQESLGAVDSIRCPVVICIAAWFGNVRLIDNMEITP